jgi:uroporphyrin-3 C-methyltransferase
MHLKLEGARVALLDGREALFHDSLAAAEKWLQQYFTGAERDALLASIQSLKSEKITVAMPDVSGSLVWLQQNGDQE